MEELKDENQKMTLAFEQLQRDHEKLKEDEQGKSKKLQEFQLLNEHREQAKQDLKGMEIKVYESSKHPFWLFLHNFSQFSIEKKSVSNSNYWRESLLEVHCVANV